MAVNVKEYQFSMDPKSISVKQHRVKASQTLHTRSCCHPAAPAHLQSARNSSEMGEDNTGSAAGGARGKGWAGGQPGDQGRTLELTACEPGSARLMEPARLGTGARSIHPTAGSSKRWAKPTGHCHPPSATSHPCQHPWPSQQHPPSCSV